MNTKANRPNPGHSPPAASEYVVHGKVFDAAGNPVPGVRMQAFDCDMRTQELLGKAVTDATGFYIIRYTSIQFARAEKGSADLRVVASNADGKEAISSGIRFNAKPDETVDLRLPFTGATLSEFETLVSTLRPLVQGVPFHELTEADLDFLASDTGIDRARIGFLRQATAFAMQVSPTSVGSRSTRLRATSVLSVVVFYGWLRSGIVTIEVAGFWLRTTVDLIAALNSAIEKTIVPRSISQQLKTIATEIDQQRIEKSLATSGPGKSASLGDLLATLPTALPIKHQRAVAATLASTSVDDASFAKQLGAAGISGPRILDIQRTLRLGVLTRQHPALTRRLQSLAKAKGDSSLKPLAQLQNDDWLDLAYSFGPPPGASIAPEEYASQLAASIEKLHATPALVAKLSGNSLAVSQPGFAAVGDFLKTHEDFDFAKTNINAYLDQAKVATGDQRNSLGTALGKLQRIRKLDATWDEVGIFINQGFSSPLDIAAAGIDRVAGRIGDAAKPDRVQAIVTSAHVIHDQSLALLTNHAPRYTRNSISVLPPAPAVDVSILQNYPSLQELFGSLDTCECRDCRSVLSPAAYFADLLNFLKPSSAAYRRLYNRRPDLWDVELSCENTETQLPYIDLVLEILENAVALPLILALPAGTNAAAALAQNPLGPAITNILGKTTLRLGTGLTAVANTATFDGISLWTITDDRRRWVIQDWLESFSVQLANTDFGVTTNQLQNIDVPTLISGLNQAQLASADQDWLNSLLLNAAQAGSHVGIFNPSFSTTSLGANWQCLFQLGATVETRPAAHGSKTLTLKSKSGVVLFTKRYSAATIATTVQLLNHGRVGGILSAILPAGFQFTAQTSVGGRWTVLSQSLQAEIAHLPEKVEVSALAYQSFSTNRDLTVEPENQNPEAYRQLQNANFPWTLPFNLPLLEVRGFLGKTNASRLALLETTAPDNYLLSNVVALEVLGISPEVAALITTPASTTSLINTPLWGYWGLTTDSQGRATIYDASSGDTFTDQPMALLARVSIVLQQARLSFNELLASLETKFVRSASTAAVSILPLDECDPSKLTLTNWTPLHLDRLHRFVRLWRALGWKPSALDLALASASAVSNQFSNTLKQLSYFARLQHRLNLPIPTIASWWGIFVTPDYHDYSVPGAPEILSVYERIFLSPTLHTPTDPDLVPTGSPPTLPSELSGQTAIALSTKADLVGAALNLAPEDLQSLADDQLGANAILTLSNLQKLFRAATLAKALRLSISDFLTARKLLETDPFADPTVTLGFCRDVDFFAASGFRWDELAYLFFHDTTPGVAIVLTDDTATQNLQNLRAALLSDTQSIDGKRDLAIGRIADLFSLDLAIAHELLTARLTKPSDGTVAASEVFIDPNFTDKTEIDRPTTAANFPDAFGLFQRLNKLAAIFSRLRIDALQLSVLADPHSSQGGFLVGDPNRLPIGAPTGSIATIFTDWRRLVALCRLRDSSAGLPAMLSSYGAALVAKDASKVLNVVTDALQVSSERVKEAATTLSIDVTFIPVLSDPLKLTNWFTLVATSKKLGATKADLDTLMAATTDFDTSALARKLLLARNRDDVGQKLVREVSDQLRTQQRDSLVDFLIALDRLRDADELYEQYLIDVEMSPCFPTTRLLQATASVQLFIQRCLANLEPNVRLVAGINQTTNALRDQWEWMKNYRVWQANREVFLFPENWLYPDLRDNKTELFTAYESELSQTQPSADSARDALLTYLGDLTEYAQVTVMGMYLDTTGTPTLYAIGRSPNPPYQYFWRTCQNFGQDLMQWTGWEKVALDLSSEHAIPFVFEGDFHVAWPVIQKSQTDNNDQPWQVQLAWARHTAKGWSKKKVSRDSFSVLPLANRDERTLLAFRAAQTSVGMDLQCYTSVANNSLGLKPVTADATDHFQVTSSVAESNQSTYVTFVVRAYLKFNDTTPPTYQSATDVTFEGLGFFCGEYFFGVARSASGVISLTGDQNAYSLASSSGVDFSFVVGTFTKFVPNAPSSATFTLDVRATAKFDGQTLPQVTISPTLKTQFSQTCLLEFIFDAGTNPDPSIAAGIPLPMAYTGRFAFSIGRDVEFVSEKSLPSLALPPHTFASMSGFQETSDETSQFGFQLDSNEPLVFGASTNALFFLCESSQSQTGSSATTSPDLWYFEEGQNRFYLALQSDATPPQLTVFPSSYTESSNFVVRAIQDLDTLYDPAQQSATFGAEQLSAYLTNTAFTLTEDPRTNSALGFDLRMPCAIHQWETFLHLPLRTAQHLTEQQRFEDAQTWLQFVFDPTTAAPGGGLAKFWRFWPFQQDVRPANIQQLLTILADPAGDSSIKRSVRNQIAAWRVAPFLPHAVARMRPSAYQWSTVFAYLDNLLAWGDQLFRGETRELIAEATQLYVLVAKILGPRPRIVPSRVTVETLSYRDLRGKWDDFSNAWIEMTDLQPVTAREDVPSKYSAAGSKAVVSKTPPTQVFSSLGVLYFCVPANDRLLTYWDQVDDRLFKIRHCQNIDGVERALPLFDPPIDPGLLVRATASGIDISTAFADQAAPLPNFRFTPLAQKATELCNELKSLSAALLAALEKKDAEQLALLRSSQEIELLNLVTQVKQKQIDEAQAQVDGLLVSQDNVLERLNQYQRLLGQSAASFSEGGDPVVEQSSPLQISKDATGDSAGLGLIKPEQDQIGKLNEALGWAWTSGIASAVASVLHLIPDQQEGSPVFQIKFGGTNLGLAASAIASLASTLGADANHHATLDSMFAGYQRRSDEWIFQSQVAVGDYKQLDKQIAAAQIRLAMAQSELANHQTQIEHAQAVDEFMRRQKFTNQDLYQWMVTQISGVFFQTYQLAYDLGKRAERAFRHELGIQDSNFIQFGSWNSLKKGLLVGDKLHNDLRRMEIAFLDKNKREFELTKHVSLRQLDPLSLLQLKVTGKCQVTVPEWLFDMDCPGHYFRRIKNVALSIPAVVGPYTSSNCTLSLVKSTIRFSTALNAAGEYERDAQADESARFVDGEATITSVVTSTGNNDTGMFETNFRDERFLPFEGAGAESTWTLELPKDFPQFDYATISDVVLHMRYTAQAASNLHDAAVTYVKTVVAQKGELGLLLNLRYDFATAWYAFVNGTGSFSAVLTRNYFPYVAQGKTIKISQFTIYNGYDLSQYHDIGTATDLTNAQPTYAITAAEDTTVPKVLTRDISASVFMIVKYSLA